MERLPHSKYTKELRLEAVRLVAEGGLSVREASARLSLPKPKAGLTCTGLRNSWATV